MKILLRLFLFLAVTAVFAADAAYGVQPHADEFPGGKPFSLKITASKDASCKQQNDKSGDPVYGNTLFVPMNGNNIQIKMQIVPGKREGEPAPFHVTDPCTASIDGDPALIQIPKDAPLYMVYARMPANSSIKTSMQIMPQFMFIQDGSGNSLVYLGKLTNSGFESAYGLLSKKKGQWSQEDITGLFEWSGSICYPKSSLCNGCVKTALCCPPGAAPGSYEGCSPKDNACPAGNSEAISYCNSFTDEWILNIAGFSNYLWTTTEKNLQKQLEVLFYPVH